MIENIITSAKEKETLKWEKIDTHKKQPEHFSEKSQANRLHLYFCPIEKY